MLGTQKAAQALWLHPLTRCHRPKNLNSRPVHRCMILAAVQVLRWGFFHIMPWCFDPRCCQQTFAICLTLSADTKVSVEQYSCQLKGPHEHPLEVKFNQPLKVLKTVAPVDVLGAEPVCVARFRMSSC